MTLPVHDIQNVKAAHRKYQMMTILFTMVTLAATLGAAFSGIQLANLKKKNLDSKKITEGAVSPPKTPVVTDDSALKEIEALKSELVREKSASLKMNAKIKDLNNQISVLKKAAAVSSPSNPKTAPALQPKPDPPTQPPQEKNPAANSAPPPSPKMPAVQKAVPIPVKPSTPAPQQGAGTDSGALSQPAPAPGPDSPVDDTVKPSPGSIAKPAPKAETAAPAGEPAATVPNDSPGSKSTP